MYSIVTPWRRRKRLSAARRLSYVPSISWRSVAGSVYMSASFAAAFASASEQQRAGSSSPRGYSLWNLLEGSGGSLVRSSCESAPTTERRAMPSAAGSAGQSPEKSESALPAKSEAKAAW